MPVRSGLKIKAEVLVCQELMVFSETFIDARRSLEGRHNAPQGFSQRNMQGCIFAHSNCESKGDAKKAPTTKKKKTTQKGKKKLKRKIT